MPSRLAIIGAGLSGLAAAYALRDHALEIHLFEKSRGVSGRAATRGRRRVRYDHGANYARLDDPRLDGLVRRELDTTGLVDIDAPVWTFGADGRIAPGDPERDGAPKWTYRDGISTLGKRLHAAGGARLHTEVRIAALAALGDGWRLQDTEGRDRGRFDAVLLTPPAPQTADLLEVSLIPAALGSRLVDALRAVPYRTQLTSVLAYDRRLERPGDAYALLNTDGEHPVAWLGFEEAKPGHVPTGGSVLVVQLAPDWSRAHYDEDAAALAQAVHPIVRDLLGADPGRPAWHDRQGWRYALPDTAADAGALAEGAARGLFFAGDYVAGRGRIGAALATGLDVAPRIAERLGL